MSDQHRQYTGGSTAMAGKGQRNYAAEYARRQANARAAGFPSYAAQRKAREAVARPRGGKPRDYAAERRRADAIAKAEGYRDRNERRRVRALVNRLIKKFDAAYAGETKYDRDRTKKRIAEFDDEQIEEVEETDPADFKGQARGNATFWYH